jgi:hypothetical protein
MDSMCSHQEQVLAVYLASGSTRRTADWLAIVTERLHRLCALQRYRLTGAAPFPAETHARVMNDGDPSAALYPRSGPFEASSIALPRLGYGAMAATSSLQKSGMSSTTRPQTMVPSRKAGSSTQMAPALTRSSLIPRLPVAR